MPDIDEMRREAKSHGDTRVVVMREFSAPQEALWKAWTDPQMMAQWYAPEPFTVPRAEMDLRPGGRYTLVMRDPEGNEFPSVGFYREIEPPSRIVFEDSVDEMPAAWVDMLNEARGEAPGTKVPNGIVTVTVDDLGGGRTLVTFDEEFGSMALRDAYVEQQMVEGLSQTFDQLAKIVERQPAGMR